ncbi:hypothetical protein AVEN_117021-1 [Araneus ventricosus]|uniref:Uncharacterized protein n=1 Tax=Araneus ventricosus TaxID=182803 RepID=A0A4Y2X0T0_ARAVE|nr:hypothetical protein AVEN_117021-1 [Araneus ventricosus]
MNSGRFPSSKKRLGKIRLTTDTPSLTPARPKIRLARTEPTKPGGAGVVIDSITNRYIREAIWHPNQLEPSSSSIIIPLSVHHHPLRVPRSTCAASVANVVTSVSEVLLVKTP